jgi:hypothetical protein
VAIRQCRTPIPFIRRNASPCKKTACTTTYHSNEMRKYGFVLRFPSTANAINYRPTGSTRAARCISTRSRSDHDGFSARLPPTQKPWDLSGYNLGDCDGGGGAELDRSQISKDWPTIATTRTAHRPQRCKLNHSTTQPPTFTLLSLFDGAARAMTNLPPVPRTGSAARSQAPSFSTSSTSPRKEFGNHIAIGMMHPEVEIWLLPQAVLWGLERIFIILHVVREG